MGEECQDKSTDDELTELTRECRTTLGKLLARNNEIVATCETDPTLRVRMPEVAE